MKNCQKCKRIIHNQSINANGFNFHPECFLCKTCNKKIQKQFYFEGKDFYHPECFQKKKNLFCRKCNKPIEGKYIEVSVSKYHEECYKNFIQLRCKICRKTIEDKYIKDENGSYHEACFNKEKAIKCSVCQEIISGSYLSDPWGNKSHKEHKGIIISNCSSCSRFLSDLTSKSFTLLDDGRKMCGICKEQEIKHWDETVLSKMRVIEQLNKVGFDYIPNNIEISMTNKINLNKKLGSSITNNTHGLTQTTTESQNGKIISQKHVINMLFGLPKLLFDGVLAHELLHVWLNHKVINMTDEETEGFCNLGTALIYKNDNSEFAKILLDNMMENKDKVYGDGYRLMDKRLNELGWKNLINEVLNYKPKLTNKVSESKDIRFFFPNI